MGMMGSRLALTYRLAVAGVLAWLSFDSSNAAPAVAFEEDAFRYSDGIRIELPKQAFSFIEEGGNPREVGGHD